MGGGEQAPPFTPAKPSPKPKPPPPPPADSGSGGSGGTGGVFGVFVGGGPFGPFPGSKPGPVDSSPDDDKPGPGGPGGGKSGGFGGTGPKGPKGPRDQRDPGPRGPRGPIELYTPQEAEIDRELLASLEDYEATMLSEVHTARRYTHARSVVTTDAASRALELGLVAPGERLLIVAGTPFGAPGAANLLRLAHAPLPIRKR